MSWRQNKRQKNRPMKNDELTTREKELEERALRGDPVARVDLRHHLAMKNGGFSKNRGGVFLKLPWLGQLDGYAARESDARF
jgi:hypothetical protein